MLLSHRNQSPLERIARIGGIQLVHTKPVSSQEKNDATLSRVVYFCESVQLAESEEKAAING